MAKSVRDMGDADNIAVDSPVPLGRVLAFMRLLWAVDHGLTQVSRRMQRTLGVTGPQRLVVLLVGQSPGVSAGALAEALHLHPSTLTGVLKRLHDRGLIERTTDPADGRRARLRLTVRGKEVDGVSAGTVEARIRTAMTGMSDADLAAAERILTHLAEVLAV
jgi:MarR family transcriptional regulator, organic hydroperoxide resistance regulator